MMPPLSESWWRDIKSEYNIKANFGIDGKNYNKYGTNFGIQMLVIDKDGPTTEPVKTAFVENVHDLQSLLGGIRNGRPDLQLENNNGNERGSVASTRPDVVTERQPEREQHNPLPDTGGGTDTAVIGTGREPTVIPEIDEVSDGAAEPAPESASVGDNGSAPIDGERHRGND